MRILAIETATDRCGVAVLDDDRVIVNLLLTRPRSHAEYLVPMIEQALRLGQWAPSDLEAIAVSMGPGSYTGLRIGVSTAKGLAYATGARVYGVPSLETLAHAAAQSAQPGDVVVPAFSARRAEVYVEAYRVDAAVEIDPERENQGGGIAADRHELVRIVDTMAVPVAGIVTTLRETDGCLVLAGDGADAIAAALNAGGRTHYRHSPVLPDAAHVGLWALAQGNAPPVDVASFEPFYLKEFVAKKPKRTIFDRLPF